MTKRKRSDPKGLQFKSFAFDTKAVAEEPDDDGFVYIEAYASVFDNVDSHNDVIVKGAYAETLNAWAAKGAPIPSFYNHGAFSSDPHDNVGFLALAQEDNVGLKVRMALDVKHNAKAAYTHRLIKQDRLRELSVGYIAKAWELIHEDGKDEWDYTRKLTALDLIEVSVVSVASNPLATVTEKAAAFLYGSPDDDDPEGDDDEKSGDDAPAVKAATDEAVTAALEAIATAREALDLAEAALAPADDEDEPAEDDPAAEDVPSDSAGTKGLSARARVALAMIALPSAETE